MPILVKDIIVGALTGWEFWDLDKPGILALPEYLVKGAGSGTATYFVKNILVSWFGLTNHVAISALSLGLMILFDTILFEYVIKNSG